MKWLLDFYILQPTLWWAGAVVCLGAGTGSPFGGWVSRLRVSRRYGRQYVPRVSGLSPLLYLLAAVVFIFTGLFIWSHLLYSAGSGDLSAYLVRIAQDPWSLWVLGLCFFVGFFWSVASAWGRLLVFALWAGLLAFFLVGFSRPLATQAGDMSINLSEQGVSFYTLHLPDLDLPQGVDRWVRLTVSGVWVSPWLTILGVPQIIFDSWRLEPAIMVKVDGALRLQHDPAYPPVNIMVTAGREFLDPVKPLVSTGVADSFALRSSFFYFPLSQGEELVLYKGKITVLSGNIGRY